MTDVVPNAEGEPTPMHVLTRGDRSMEFAAVWSARSALTALRVAGFEIVRAEPQLADSPAGDPVEQPEI